MEDTVALIVVIVIMIAGTFLYLTREQTSCERAGGVLVRGAMAGFTCLMPPKEEPAR